MDAFDYGMAFLFFYMCITLPMVLRSATQALAVCKPLQIQELHLTPRGACLHLADCPHLLGRKARSYRLCKDCCPTLRTF